MNIEEFRKYMRNYEQQIETHPDDWIVMCSYAIVNNVTFCGVRSIRLVKDDTVWLDTNHINIKDIDSFVILPVRKYSR